MLRPPSVTVQRLFPLAVKHATRKHTVRGMARGDSLAQSRFVAGLFGLAA